MTAKFDIIYADPPWNFKTFSQKGKEKKSADCHYGCMDIEDIKSIPVSRIASDDSILFLWVTFPLLREGLETMRSWGFTYKTCGFVWVKRNRKADSYFWGLGYWTRANAELCLIGTKGHPKRECRGISQICDARIMEHSRKPDEIRERIVMLCGDKPRVELFARQRHDGWTSLGNEIDGRDIVTAVTEIANDSGEEMII